MEWNNWNVVDDDDADDSICYRSEVGTLQHYYGHKKMRNTAYNTIVIQQRSAISVAVEFFLSLLILVTGIAKLAMASPKAINLMGAGQLAAHEPNYCNRSAAAAAAGLLRSPLGQFLGFPCSNEFFHCRWQSDGYRTYKKNCRPGLVYDTLGTQNCNYDYNVKGCAISSDPAKCKASEFVCPLSESCVSLAQRCDGKYDCVLEEDEQNCPMCRAGEFPCVISEQCILMSGRCNGVQECQDGTDEQDCETCGADKFLCRKSGKCIDGKLRCDGVTQCPHGEDELLCKKAAGDQADAPFLRMYMCENRRAQVPRHTVCDGVANCPDASDEKYCNNADSEEANALPESTGKDNLNQIGYEFANDTVAEFDAPQNDKIANYGSNMGAANSNPALSVDSSFDMVALEIERSKGTNYKIDDTVNDNQTMSYNPPILSDQMSPNFEKYSGLEQVQDSPKVQSEFEALNVNPSPEDTIAMSEFQNGNELRYSSLKNESLENDLKMNLKEDPKQEQDPVNQSSITLEDSGTVVPNPPSDSTTNLQRYDLNSGPKSENGEENPFKSSKFLDPVGANSTLEPTESSQIDDGDNLGTEKSSVPIGYADYRARITWKENPLANPWQIADSDINDGIVNRGERFVERNESAKEQESQEFKKIPMDAQGESEGLDSSKKPKRKTDEGLRQRIESEVFENNSNYTKETQTLASDPLGQDHLAACSSSTQRDHRGPECGSLQGQSAEAVEREIVRRFTSKYGRKARWDPERDILQKIESILLTKNATEEESATIGSSAAQFTVATETSENPALTRSLSPSDSKFRHISTGKTIRVTGQPTVQKWRASPSNGLQNTSSMSLPMLNPFI